MAIDLTLVAEHDILIERIAIRVNAKRGHRAYHDAVVSAATLGDIVVTTRAGWFVYYNLTTPSGGSNPSYGFYDGPSTNNRLVIGFSGHASGPVGSWDARGIPFWNGLILNVTTLGDTLPNYLHVYWWEACTCAIGHDHHGAPAPGPNQESD